MKKGHKLNSRKVLFISKLALVSVLGCVVVRTVTIPQHTRKILISSAAADTENARAVETTSLPDISVEDYSVIIERNIFGNAASSSGANKPLGGDAADSLLQSTQEELGLALLGTVAGCPSVSRAIIENLETNALGVYKTGDTIAAAHIESIEKDGVILLHQGQRKRLNLGPRSYKQNRTSNTRAASPKNITHQAIAGKTSSPVEFHTTIATKLKNIETVLKNAVINPYVVDGQVEGLRITGLEKIDGAADLGIKNGDVIYAVNGHRLTSKQKTYQVFKKARSQPMMDIELLRDNEIKTLSFSLR